VSAILTNYEHIQYGMAGRKLSTYCAGLLGLEKYMHMILPYLAYNHCGMAEKKLSTYFAGLLGLEK
jgi:hypothetical protein